MEGSAFCRNIIEHDRLHFGKGPRADRVYVVFAGPDEVRVGWELEPATIRTHSWETLEAVLTGKRRPEVMNHITRIVGYYSHLRGWTRSKLAELRDRRNGEYAVPGALAHDHAGETPASKRSHPEGVTA
jgi:hypothetical protein